MNRWLPRMLWSVLLAASLGVIVWTLGGMVGSVRVATAGQSSPDLVMLLGKSPIEIEPIPVRVDVGYDPAELARFSDWASGPIAGEAEPQARTRKLHAARLPSLRASSPEWLVYDDAHLARQVKLPKQAFQRSWRGLEMAETVEGKKTEHRDQTLAALADLKVSLLATIELEVGTYKVRDLLRTSLDEFHLGQEEISWTASAYVAYLPPQSTWRNRYGEWFSFDRLAEEMMRRPFTGESCGGIHLILALTKIARVDQDLKILDTGVRGRLTGYLRDKVSEAVNSQSDDGSWPMCWSPTQSVGGAGETTPEPTDTGRVAITGHLLEWFHLLPVDMKPPARAVKAGTLWIASKLRSSARATVTENFCPYTHAIVSLDFAASAPTR